MKFSVPDHDAPLDESWLEPLYAIRDVEAQVGFDGIILNGELPRRAAALAGAWARLHPLNSPPTGLGRWRTSRSLALSRCHECAHSRPIR